ncbi:hypothetical protein LTR85_001214 [Meristemomyces frigidus]|nr:hypothetical protein LTR85_001214 [Meristemomyces frigidus]
MRANHLFPLLPVTAYLTCDTVALPVADSDSDGGAVNLIYEFPNETWVENLAIRANGNILTTIIGRPEVWEVFPCNHTAQLVHTFPDATSALGIAEVEPDVFAIASGTFDLVTVTGTKGTWSIWTIDLSQHKSYQRADGGWNASSFGAMKVADIPEAIFLNGMTTLASEHHTILVADSALGVIFKVNTATGVYSIAIDDSALKPNTSIPFALGVNGIQTSGDGYLYFTNSAQAPFLARVLLSANGTAAGPVETILAESPYPTNNGFQADDFALDAESNAWITGDPSDYLVKVTPSGGATQVLGGINSSVIAGDTAAQFGRTARDKKTLYIVTNGGLPYPPASGIVGGNVIAVDTEGL